MSKEEAETPKPQEVNQLKIGDIEILSTNQNLKSCVGVVKNMLKDSTIKNYLDIQIPQKKLLGL